MTAREFLLSRVYRAGYPVMRAVWFVTRPEIHGSKCVLLHGDRVLLVRHTYGDRGRWDLPGGALRPGEDPLDGARRELREETGLQPTELIAAGSFQIRLEFRLDTVHCFACRLDGQPGAATVLQLDHAEIRQARWFPLDSLPVKIGAAARRAVEMGVTAME
jgi:8-oxo-dGTP pyrophosphatase MutT (NUDIX family)